MTTASRTGDAPPSRPVPELPTLRGLVLAHRRLSAAVVLLLVVVVGLAVAMTLASSQAKAGALTDASTCTQWSSAAGAQQMAYSRHYIDQHGGAGFLSAAALTSTIRSDCVRAAYLGESDDVSVVGALKHAF